MMPDGWCLNHQHAMTYTSEHGGYWYCDVSGKPNWPAPEMHPTRRDLDRMEGL